MAQKLRLHFARQEDARWLSHLDLLANIEYALRRARLPLALSEGFNPRPRMSLAAPLAVGYLAENEILEITLREPRDPDTVIAVLNETMPAGIVVTAAAEVPVEGKTAAAHVVGATYRVALSAPVPDLDARLAVLGNATTLIVQEERKDGPRERDLRPLIDHMEAVDARSFRLYTHLSEAGAVRPEMLLPFLGLPADGVRVTRERLELAGA